MKMQEDQHMEIWKEAQRELARKKKVEELRMRKATLVNQCVENFNKLPTNGNKV